MALIKSLVALAASVAVCALPAWAGPPLICHSVDIGSAHSLPWLATGSWNGADPAYDISHLVDDTLGLLRADTSAPVRTETIRRAVIYSARYPGLSDRLLSRLMARALSAQAAGRPDPEAWFDAGYAIETVRQAARIYGMLHAPEREAWTIRTDPQIDGLPFLRMAVRLGYGVAIRAPVL
jgi:hypothetical protein